MNDHYTNNRVSPQRAIVVYSNKTKSEFFLESREIKTVNGKYILMAAVPMADTVLREIAKSYMKTNASDMSFCGLIPSHILHGSNKPGQTIVMWYRPAAKRKLNFASHLNIKGESMVNIPATLYVVVNTKLYLFALASSERPSAKTKIYNAPFFNIYENGNVCLGTAHVGKVKASTYQGEAERFERAFYMAEQNGGQSRESCKTPLDKLWTSLIKSKAVFPSKELRQHKQFKTLGDIISKLIGNDSHIDDED